MTKTKQLPKPPPLKAIPASTRPPTQIENWYLTCLRTLTAHYGRPPSIVELAKYCKRAINPTWEAMRSLEAKGNVKRNERRRFVEVAQ